MAASGLLTMRDHNAGKYPRQGYLPATGFCRMTAPGALRRLAKAASEAWRGVESSCLGKAA